MQILFQLNRPYHITWIPIYTSDYLVNNHVQQRLIKRKRPIYLAELHNFDHRSAYSLLVAEDRIESRPTSLSTGQGMLGLSIQDLVLGVSPDFQSTVTTISDRLLSCRNLLTGIYYSQ